MITGAIDLVDEDREAQGYFNLRQFIARLDDQEMGQFGKIEVIA